MNDWISLQHVLKVSFIPGTSQRNQKTAFFSPCSIVAIWERKAEFFKSQRLKSDFGDFLYGLTINAQTLVSFSPSDLNET